MTQWDVDTQIPGPTGIPDQGSAMSPVDHPAPPLRFVFHQGHLLGLPAASSLPGSRPGPHEPFLHILAGPLLGQWKARRRHWGGAEHGPRVPLRDSLALPGLPGGGSLHCITRRECSPPWVLAQGWCLLTLKVDWVSCHVSDRPSGKFAM